MIVAEISQLLPRFHPLHTVAEILTEQYIWLIYFLRVEATPLLLWLHRASLPLLPSIVAFHCFQEQRPLFINI